MESTLLVPFGLKRAVASSSLCFKRSQALLFVEDCMEFVLLIVKLAFLCHFVLIVSELEATAYPAMGHSWLNHSCISDERHLEILPG